MGPRVAGGLQREARERRVIAAFAGSQPLIKWTAFRALGVGREADSGVWKACRLVRFGRVQHGVQEAGKPGVQVIAPK